MNNILKKISGLILAAVIFAGCKKEVGPLSDFIPTDAVTVSNATDFRPGPTVRSSLATGTITITLALPSGSARTIKEITRVSANTSYTQVQGTTGLYNTAPIAASGKSVTFNTTHAEYVSRAAGVIPAANAELAKRFYFLLTLDDGSQIIPTDVRVLITP